MTKEITEMRKGEHVKHKGRLIIKCDVPEDATVEVENGGLNIKGNVLKGSKILLGGSGGSSGGTYELLVQGSLMEDVTVSSAAPITIHGNIGPRCNISSSQEGLNAINVGENSVIAVSEQINVQNVSDRCEMTSLMSGLNAKDIGSHVRIHARDTINVRNVKPLSYIHSGREGINAHHVARVVILHAREKINAGSVGSNSKLKSMMGGVRVEQVADRATIEAWEKITVDGAVGVNTRLKSLREGIVVRGNINHHAVLKARESIQVNDVGASAQLTSTMEGITTGSVGPNATIRARENVSIRGSKAHSANVSSMGRVSVRNTLPPEHRPINSNPARYDSQLQQALRASLLDQRDRPQDNDEKASHLSEDEQLAMALSASLIQQPPVGQLNNSSGLFAASKGPQNISPALRRYVDSFNGKPSNLERYEKLGISPESEGAVDIECPITQDLPEKPVRLDGEIYDFDALVKLPRDADGNRENPLTRDKFSLLEVQAARDVQDKIDEMFASYENVSKLGSDHQPNQSGMSG